MTGLGWRCNTCYRSKHAKVFPPLLGIVFLLRFLPRRMQAAICFSVDFLSSYNFMTHKSWSVIHSANSSAINSCIYKFQMCFFLPHYLRRQNSQVFSPAPDYLSVFITASFYFLPQWDWSLSRQTLENAMHIQSRKHSDIRASSKAEMTEMSLKTIEKGPLGIKHNGPYLSSEMFLNSI